MNPPDPTPDCKPPASCTPAELAAFESIVRQAFGGSDAELPARISNARCLAFLPGAGGAPDAISGLKQPTTDHRRDLFAAARADGAPPALELGWVWVTPALRARGRARRLCTHLLAHAAAEPVFATTRPDNAPMQRILRTLGFAPHGVPFTHPRRDEQLLLFAR